MRQPAPTRAQTATTDGAPRPPQPDPLLHPDPAHAAHAAAIEHLLRCWTRETDTPRPHDDVLTIRTPDGRTELRAPLRHWSRSGWHRFDPPVLHHTDTGHTHHPAPTEVAALLSACAATHGGATPDGHPAPAPAAGDAHATADLLARVADSTRVVTQILTARRRDPAPPTTDLFLTAEQSLLLGHPLHPAPKSRDDLDPASTAAWSPELRGSFPLHWFAVHHDLVATDSAAELPATELLARHAAAPATPPGTLPLPAHPWQATHLADRPEWARLIDDGLLRPLGPAGPHWHPTSSVRTVHRSGQPWMLKLSLGLRITNSRRENLRKELHRGTEVHRLLETGLARRWHAAHPRFDIVRDPAWIGVDHPNTADTPDTARPGPLDTVLRANPFAPTDDVTCVAALVAENPLPDDPAGGRSRLAALLHRLAARSGRPVPQVATEWFLRYLATVVAPVVWLDGHAGIALEAHQQNTLVLLDPDGWPNGGRYRDNQGYYFRASAADRLDAALPGIGGHSDTFVEDPVVDERFAYYLGINNILGLVGALGSQRLADEDTLLAAARDALRSLTPTGSPLPALLLERPTLRCKANLLTRLGGLDELVGPVHSQSVYVTIGNPLHAAPDHP
ncbi:IucA/IucC family protein [Allostreptomyces psammosilenae]|uniref:Siderophore synthetase component n=1 Tax=Allostreptomyces psammosilenae TaxID=1892865 RepID=A0A852ZL44_9ACTN|nr:IucA/IucC family protein [Allostreptomyces psammosilenae]NYI03096.1 siderophore synthetase component [Allostreptomyces psammosilenae]